MSRKYRSGRRSTIVSVGWLFADLLLALAMLFLIASVVNEPKPVQKPKPTPTPVIPTPTPTPILRLETRSARFSITIDSGGLLAGSQNAINDIKSKIRAQRVLHGRRVGLAIVYGGAPGDGDISNAELIALKMYDVLRSLGKDRFAFTNASYYDPLYLLGGDPNTVTIDVFLFTQT